MAKIFYSMSGDGRGHATRVKTLVDHLRTRHEVHLLTSRDAFDLLGAAYRDDPNVRVHRIPGLVFKYRRQRVDYFRCVLQGVPYLWRISREIRKVVALIEQYGCDLAITDFDPLLPRAAHQLDLPYICIDHQHILTVSDFSKLPWNLRWRAKFVSLSVPLFYTTQKETIVSSFYHPPLKKNVRNVRQVGVLLRDTLLQTPPRAGEHLLVYLRRYARPKLLEALRRCGRPVKIYGLGARTREGNVEYHEVDEVGFLTDLVHCHALVCNAGNQLVGEALYLQKPILALPESGNFEQMLNAYFVTQSGGGIAADFDAVDDAQLQEFLQQVDQLRSACVAERIIGNQQVIEAIERHLSGADDSPARSPSPVLASR